MDIETLRLALQQASLAGLGAGFLAGLIFAFNPIVFASIPVVLAYVTKATNRAGRPCWVAHSSAVYSQHTRYWA